MNDIPIGGALSAAFFGLLVAVGCASSHGQGEACGPTTCASGTFCCNESCGICVAPGEGCIDLYCAPADAGPLDDAGPGQVCGDQVCGVGTRCCPGCSGPSGADSYCGPLHQSCGLLACDGGVAPRRCGGFAGLRCAPDEYCDYPEHAMCGAGDQQGTCRPRPTGCPADCPGVCGCDGVTYCNACTANGAGTSVAYDSACEAATCAPMDARGEGACRRVIGYIWNGAECQMISGCECVGTDCADVAANETECQRRFAACRA